MGRGDVTSSLQNARLSDDKGASVPVSSSISGRAAKSASRIACFATKRLAVGSAFAPATRWVWLGRIKSVFPSAVDDKDSTSERRREDSGDAHAGESMNEDGRDEQEGEDELVAEAADEPITCAAPFVTRSMTQKPYWCKCDRTAGEDSCCASAAAMEGGAPGAASVVAACVFIHRSPDVVAGRAE